MFSRLISILLVSIVATAPACLPAQKRPAAVPFVVEQNSGSRPVVRGTMNGVPFRFIVHSNASAPVQMNHRWAARVGIMNLRHTGSYGIVARGQVSSLGRDDGVLRLLQIGAHRYRDLSAAVFETPNPRATGMLGTGWIRQADLIMDFPAHVLRLGVGRQKAEQLNRALRRRGYACVPMRYDEATRRYRVDVTIGSATRPMIVSTVAGLVVDDTFARDSGLARGEIASELNGPAGAVENSYPFARQSVLHIGEWTSRPTVGVIEDIYAYAGAARPAQGAAGGMLGADFLIANGAVVDFARKRLYLRRI